MRHIFIILATILISGSCQTLQNNSIKQSGSDISFIADTADLNNNFYDNTETFALPVNKIEVSGEVANPGVIDLSNLVKRSVIVKETLLDSTGGDTFTGAYRYDGYSLFDILNTFVLQKKNVDEFSQIIDLYVEIENDKGDKAVFSWGEIFYPNNLHEIIIASNVSRIVPSKSKDLWPIATESKVVAANDLITERNISNPVRIRVVSYPRSFPMLSNLNPMYSSTINLFAGDLAAGEISKLPGELNTETINLIFYGRGKGIHSTLPFSGVMLKDLLKEYYPLNRKNLQEGIICIAGKDGYRTVLSYSELFNRNDQQEFLLVPSEPDEDGGLFRIIAISDFFSDRAIKSISEIRLSY